MNEKEDSFFTKKINKRMLILLIIGIALAIPYFVVEFAGLGLVLLSILGMSFVACSLIILFYIKKKIGDYFILLIIALFLTISFFWALFSDNELLCIHIGILMVGFFSVIRI